jgi:hypothetical protein
MVVTKHAGKPQFMFHTELKIAYCQLTDVAGGSFRSLSALGSTFYIMNLKANT